MAFARAALFLSLVLVTAACAGSGAATTAVDGTITIPNHGGSMEGHTPTGFAGSGTGLFAGDNLNATFPEGEGVQLFVTFSLADSVPVGRAVLTSDALHVTGDPFSGLGNLLAEPVEYAVFSPELFDSPAVGPPVPCRMTGGTNVECDVSAALRDAADGGRGTAQFRLRFEQASDNDGEPDLALFYRTDSNTNESGLFMLTLTSDS